MTTRLSIHAPLFTLLLLACFAACAPLPPEPHEHVGSVALALQSTSDGSSYELRSASFVILGPTELMLDSDASPDAETLDAELAIGEYTVELVGGWQLFEVTSAPRAVTATLVSDNPLPFTIEADQTTSVRFRFEVDGEPVDLGGQLQLGFDVEAAVSRNVVFSELMTNPAALGDSDGEWIEVTNAGTDPIDLGGCVIQRDTTQFTIDGNLELQPGASAALANSAAPGFVPSYVYSGLTLPNSAVFVLSLTCQGQVLDSITVDPATWPGDAGISASLSGDAHSPTTNDDATRWCNATTAYATDLGTPGAQNPNCG